MTTEDLAKLVKLTRDAQRAYFRHRGQPELVASKELEKRLDDAVENILGTQGTLFPTRGRR